MKYLAPSACVLLKLIKGGHLITRAQSDCRVNSVSVQESRKNYLISQWKLLRPLFCALNKNQLIFLFENPVITANVYHLLEPHPLFSSEERKGVETNNTNFKRPEDFTLQHLITLKVISLSCFRCLVFIVSFLFKSFSRSFLTDRVIIYLTLLCQYDHL